MLDDDVQGVFCADWQPVSGSSSVPSSGTLVVAVALKDISVELALLDERERERGQRLRTTELQQRYFAAHTALRQILGWRLNCLPDRLIFHDNAHGKPHLAHHSFAFNLSHSDSYALIAMAEHGTVGVDLERRDPLRELDLMADQVFAARELTLFRALPLRQRQHAFFIAWTRKEAALKALGLGLPGGMEHVVFHADYPLILGNFTALPGLRELQIVDLVTSIEFAAALCHGPQSDPVHCLRWLSNITSATSPLGAHLPTADTN
jgi:phosphopantetheinyl transferase